MPGPRFHAIFLRQIPGDHALLRLAQARFAAAGLGAEFYPSTPDELAEELQFRPDPGALITVHLPRQLRVFDQPSREKVTEYARRFAGSAYGLVLHDQPETASRPEEYLAAARDLDARLRADGPGPLVFIEYAAGITPDAFAALFEGLADCPRVSCCIDVSHVGVQQARVAYEARFPGEDVCRLKWNSPELRPRVAEVQAANATSLPVVCDLVSRIGRIGKPLHFHLHDSHTASTFSAYGVSDHLSFFHVIPLPFAHQGARSLPLMYGPLGLNRIIATARAALPPEKLSFTLEIHPPEGRLGLGEFDGLFSHWADRTNAERMNHWIEVLLVCHRLLRQCWAG